MRPLRVALLALGAAVAAVAGIAVLGGNGDENYRVRLEMANASALREGRPVRIGGAEVGQVDSLDLGRGDVVVAELKLDSAAGRIGRGAWAKVKPTNLLAEKVVELHPGDVSSPLPSGTTIPRSRVKDSVDLDQVIDVLDADTRTRLGILINEAGLAFTGRRADFNALLRRLPADLAEATHLLEELVSDNDTLGHLVESSDRFITRLTTERRSLSRVIDVAGQTMSTVSARRTELRETLARAPAALATMRRFLRDLRLTTKPLGPAARATASAAPALQSTLAELEPFRRAAEPVLREGVAAAPLLTRLGVKATPILRRSSPPLRELASFARALAPINRVLDRGGHTRNRTSPGAIDDLLATVHEWSMAVQPRDSASHMFRGFLDFNADVIRQAVERYVNSNRAPAKSRRRARRAAPRPDQGRSPETGRSTGRPLPQLERPVAGLKDKLDRLPTLPQQESSPTTRLLDFLLKP